MNVTVVIPTADRGEMLNRAIKSVLRQTVRPREILVVDNGVAEAKIAVNFVDHVKLLRTEPKIGPARARNIGAENASSVYVAFLDDDDTWEPEYLEHVMNTLESKDADVVVGRLDKAGRDGTASPYKMFPLDVKKQRKVYYKNPGFGGQNIVIRLDFFKGLGGFDELMHQSEDRDLAARILQRGGRIFPQPLAVAVLCEHVGKRARHRKLQSNWLFIKKHWKEMSWYELFKSLKMYRKRCKESRRAKGSG